MIARRDRALAAAGACNLLADGCNRLCPGKLDRGTLRLAASKVSASWIPVAGPHLDASRPHTGRVTGTDGRVGRTVMGGVVLPLSDRVG